MKYIVLIAVLALASCASNGKSCATKGACKTKKEVTKSCSTKGDCKTKKRKSCKTKVKKDCSKPCKTACKTKKEI